ncbi:UNVERIFIED_CONTAM: hypothetical protein HDU68_011754 [Siphonaria sp. JEL0065]|nr:hypothetical protein HDU68_011754 [Siphonaria sp. JEL0065]
MAISDYLPGLHGYHVLALGTATGMVLHTTFVASLIQFKTLPKQTFSQLQSKQFPIYFALSFGLTTFLTYSTYRLSHFTEPQGFLDTIAKNIATSTAKSNDAWTVGIIAAGAVASLVNFAYVGPATRQAKILREQIEKTGADAPKDIVRRFGRLHGISSLLNLVVAGSLVANCLWVGNKWSKYI